MKNALVLIDYINDIIHPEGKIASCCQMVATQGIISKVNTLVNYARTQGWLIIWVKVCFDSSYREVNVNSEIFNKAKLAGALVKNTWGTELIADLDYTNNELIIFKNRINAFYMTNLELILKSNLITNLYIAGVSSDMAIQSTARDAHDRDFKVYVVEDLCASKIIEDHVDSMRVLARLATITNSQTIINS